MKILVVLSTLIAIGSLFLFSCDGSSVSELQLHEIRGGACYNLNHGACATPATFGYSSCTNPAVVCPFNGTEGSNCNQGSTNGWYQWNNSRDTHQNAVAGKTNWMEMEPDFCIVQKQCKCHAFGEDFVCVTQVAGGFAESYIKWEDQFTPEMLTGDSCPAGS